MAWGYYKDGMTAISFLFPTLRILLEDYQPGITLYPDTTLEQGVQSAVLLNKVPGFTLDGTRTNITPDLVGAGTTPKNFALTIYHTVRLFLMSKPESSSYRTRAISEKYTGLAQRFMTALELDIWDLEQGSPLLGWQSYHAWVQGMMGLPVGLVLTNVNVHAPFFTANVSTAGVTIAPSSPAN